MHAERRRSTRIEVRIPLFVYGYTPRSRPFHGEAYTVSINGTGGLIAMAAGIRPGQSLVITNEGNESTQECEVVSVRTRFARRNHIAIKFREPAPHFWSGLRIGKAHEAREESAAAASRP